MRMFNGACVPHGCKYGYQRIGSKDGFKCEQRKDAFYQAESQFGWKTTALCIAVILLIISVIVNIICCLGKR